MIDINTYTGNWPFRPLKYSKPGDLIHHLKSNNIQKALVSPIEGLFYDDPQLANENLYVVLKDLPNLLPVAVINPKIANWSESMEKCFVGMRFSAIKLHPNYHYYDIPSDSAYKMLDLAGQMNIAVIVQMRIQDMRAQSNLGKVKDVNVTEIIKAARDHRKTRFVLGGIKWGEASVSAQDIKELDNVWLDISNIEYMDGLRRMIQLYGSQKLVFGTHTPFFVAKSAALKLQAAGLSDSERKAITVNNTQAILNKYEVKNE